MEGRVGVNSVNGGVIRFRNRSCDCLETRASVKISESARNPGKLFFCCGKDGRCDYFEWWVPGRDEFNFPLCWVGDEFKESIGDLTEQLRELKERVKRRDEHEKTSYCDVVYSSLHYLQSIEMVYSICQ